MWSLPLDNYIYNSINKVEVEEITEIAIKRICGFIERKVTKFGSGAKLGCFKDLLNWKVYLIIAKDKE